MTARHVPTIDLDHAEFFSGGVVIAREPALIKSHLKPDGYRHPAVDLVMLEDETTTHQCRKCGRTWGSAHSVSAHQRTHSAKSELRRLQTEQLKLPETTGVADRTKPAESRTSRRNERGPDTRPRKSIKRVAARDAVVSGSAKVAVTKEWAHVIRRLRVLHDELDSLSIEVTRLAVGSSTHSPKSIDKDILEKAKKYDQLKGLIS